MHICVVGSGYVGLVSGTCFAEMGMNTICVDTDAEKIENLKKFKLPIYEPGLEELVKININAGRLEFTTNLGEAISKSLVIFIAVGTPSKSDGSVDLSCVDKVAQSIGEQMDEYKVVVNKSTVPVGTGERVRDIIKKHQKKSINFDVVSNPEFLREGSAIEDFMRPNRVVVGASSDHARAIMKELYSPLYLLETPFITTTVRTAEMIKYASNAFLATKISFINEMANLCEVTGADVSDVAVGMGLDNRIGRKFLHAGPGFGGSCFPKDTMGLEHMAAEHDYDFKILKAVIRTNKEQRIRMVKKIKDAVGDLKGVSICFLGLSFKPNTDDVRDAPAIDIINSLLKEGATIRAFDPIAMENAKKAISKDKGKIIYCNNILEAAAGVSAIVVAVEWYQFRNIQLDEVKKVIKKPVFIDLKNIYAPEKLEKFGFKYHGVGRG